MPLPDIDDYNATFGGSKVNYAPVEDVTTDEDAAVRNAYVADVAMMTPTAIRGWVRFTASATAPVLVAHNANWGTGAGVAPVLARTGVGVFTITVPATVTDPLGNTHTVNLRDAWVNARGAATFLFCGAVVTSANVITVYIGSAAGAASDAAGTDFGVIYI